MSPRRARGTFVTGTPAPRQWQREWQTVRASVDALAQAFQDTQPSIVTTDGSITQAPLQPSDGVVAQRYACMLRVHSERDEPYSVIAIYLMRPSSERRPSATEAKPWCHCWRPCARVGWRRRGRRSPSVVPTWRVARHLNIAVGEPVAEVRRVFIDEAQRVIHLAEVTYRGDSAPGDGPASARSGPPQALKLGTAVRTAQPARHTGGLRRPPPSPEIRAWRADRGPRPGRGHRSGAPRRLAV